MYLIIVNDEELLHLQNEMIHCQNYSECLLKTFIKFDAFPERVERIRASLDSVKDVLAQIDYMLSSRNSGISNLYVLELSRYQIYTIFNELLVCQRDFELGLLYCFDDIDNVEQAEIDKSKNRCSINLRLLDQIVNVIGKVR